MPMSGADPSAAPDIRPIWRNRAVAGPMLGALLSFVLVLAGSWLATGQTPPAITDGTGGAPPGFVGKAVCATCHASEASAWTGSHHDLAMQHPTQESVLGDFADAVFEHYGLRSRFFRRDGRFMVETEGRSGALETFEIAYVFGVYPLQQYLIAFPDGRLQALGVAWDSRPTADGGGRWFHLYPGERIGPDDPLHWTRPSQNWNHMCADCHSTGLRKGYDAGADRFITTWSEINVSCEACHGAGARHVGWASGAAAARAADPRKGFALQLDDRRGVTWTIDPASGTARRSSPPGPRHEVEACGLCHSRRGTIAEEWQPGQPLTQTHDLALLRRGLFEADGQMRDEVYNDQSFRQSRMFAAGVTCGDCHEPHSLALRAEGSGVCQQCHDVLRFETAAHRAHARADPVPTCIDCHMPARTYMVVDRRHDHGFRIPRPDLSVQIGTPNACNDCHRTQTAGWAAEAIERWHGPNRKGFQTWAPAMHAAHAGQGDAAAMLAAVIRDPAVPAIARASAYAELGPLLVPALLEDVRRGLADGDPLVRIGALRSLQPLPVQSRWALAAMVLADPVRAVRIEAARLLADALPAQLAPAERATFDRAAADFVAAQRLNADRADSRTALGTFFAMRGDAAAAEAEYRSALRLDPQYAIAAINLADLYRAQRRDSEAEPVLRAAIAEAPRDAALRHVLGLVMVRLRRTPEALVLLAEARELEPSHARYAFVHAVALHSSGRTGEALEVLGRNNARHPRDVDTLTALLSINRDLGRVTDALSWGEKLQAVAPATPGLAATLDELRRAAANPATPRLGPRR